MTRPSAVRALPPPVDEGNPPTLLASFWRELAPAPGRLGDTLRLTVLVLISVCISEIFRIPEVALSAYIVLFVSKGEAVSTVLSAAVAGLAAVFAVLATIVAFMLSLSEPALRIPLIAALTFLAMFLSRATVLGPVAFAAGFIMAYGLTLGDEVLPLSLLPGQVGNTTSFAVPELALVPPEEALLHFLLWLGVCVAMPVGLVIAANLLAGRDPASMLRTALTERLTAAARVAAGEPGSEAPFVSFLREGTADLLKLDHLSGLLHRAPPPPAWGKPMITAVGRLYLWLQAWRRLPDSARSPGLLLPIAKVCSDAARTILDRREHDGIATVHPSRSRSLFSRVIQTSGDSTSSHHASGDHALVAELARASEAIRNAASDQSSEDRKGSAAGALRSPRHLLVPDAFTNRAYSRFAFKVTLAVILSYLFENLTDWPGIHTCVITCFFVSLDTIGETMHKATLRIVGCLIGATLGIGTILFLMPLMTDLGDLLASIAAVTLLAGWVATGSERISYAGWQIALAFYLVVLQGYGPTLDMETARDRVVGILIGNIVVFVIFTTVWPVRVADIALRHLASALDELATLIGMTARPQATPSATDRAAAEQGFAKAIDQSRAVLVNDRYEPGKGLQARAPKPIDAAILASVQDLIVPISVILDLNEDPLWPQVPGTIRNTILAYHERMAAWFRRGAGWLRQGADAATLAASLPEPPLLPGTIETEPDELRSVAEHLALRSAWYAELDQDIRAILDEVAPRQETPKAGWRVAATASS